jgi:Fe-S cluster assembly scaffold protein SufB
VHRLGGEGLFYLQSRGLDTKNAEALLLSGEIRKHLDTIDDTIKKEFCKENKIKLIRIKYNKNIEEILTKHLLK